jgi:hypothetical protein
MKMIFGDLLLAAYNKRLQVSPAAIVPAVVSLINRLRDIWLSLVGLSSKWSFKLLEFTPNLLSMKFAM